MQSMANNNQPKIIEIQMDLTISTCIENGTIVQNFIAKNGKSGLIKSLSEMILSQSQFFNFKQNFNSIQAVVCAGDLIERFQTETIEDFLLMFKYARQGLLGEKVWRLDSEVLFKWMGNYLEMKYEERERLELKSKSDLNNVIPDENLSEESRQKLEKFHKAFTERHNKKKLDKNSTEFIDHHQTFINRLPGVVKGLTDDELKKEMSKAKHSKLMDAYRIYENELNSRSKLAETNENNS